MNNTKMKMSLISLGVLSALNLNAAELFNTQKTFTQATQLMASNPSINQAYTY
ncbi:hypothetical protein [Aliikangiella maris]|uniref:TolC family protein n=2 Tax=Aliikangiella maris TaxID=3162458 RepID=A0ABV3MLH9_9GAMM